MASEHTIRGTFSPNGDVKIEGVGYKNNSCLADTKSFEEALGVVAERKLKPEASIKAPVSAGGLQIKK